MTVSDDGTAVLWDTQSGTKVLTIGGGNDSFELAAVSSDGRRILTVSAGRAVVWNAQTGEHLGELARDDTNDMSFVALSPDGQYALTGSADQTAVLWDARTGKRLRSFDQGSRATSAAFTSDGRQVVVGSRDRRMAILWEVDTGRQFQVFVGHTDQLWTVAFGPSGQQIATGSGDNSAVLWGARGREIRVFAGHAREVRSVAISPDGQGLLTGSGDSSAVLWKASTGDKVRTFAGHTQPINSVAFSPDGRKILTGSADETAILWDAQSGDRLLTFRGQSHCVSAVAFCPDGEKLLTGSGYSAHPNGIYAALLWDARTGERLRTIPGHKELIQALAVSPDGQQALTGSSDKTAVLWNLQTGERIRGFAGHSADGVDSVAFSPDGRRVLTGSWDNTVVLWDKATGKIVQRLATISLHVRSIALSPDGSLIAAATRDSARLWSSATGQELAQLISIDAGKDWLVVTPDGVFDGSENARKKYVRFRDPDDPMKVLPAEPRFKDYYHPNLLADILAGHAIAPPGWKVTTIRFVPKQGAADGGQGSEKKPKPAAK